MPLKLLQLGVALRKKHLFFFPKVMSPKKVLPFAPLSSSPLSLYSPRVGRALVAESDRPLDDNTTLNQFLRTIRTGYPDPEKIARLEGKDFFYQGKVLGNTILHELANCGTSASFGVVLERLSDEDFAYAMTVQNNYGATPFYYIAANGYANLLSLIVRRFGQVLSGLNFSQNHEGDSVDITKNALEGLSDSEVVSRLLAKAINQPTAYGVTPLLASIYGGHPLVAMLLLENFCVVGGYQPSMADNPLSAVLRLGEVNLAKYMIDHHERLLSLSEKNKADVSPDYLLKAYEYLDSCLDKHDRCGDGRSFSEEAYSSTNFTIFHLAAQLDTNIVFRGLYKQFEALKKKVIGPEGVIVDSAAIDAQVFSKIAYESAYCHDANSVHIAAEMGSSELVAEIIELLRASGQSDILTMETSTGRIPLDISYRSYQLSKSFYPSSSQLQSRYKLVHELFLSEYTAISVEEKNKRRESLIDQLKEASHRQDSWDLVRGGDERLFVGDGADLFAQRIQKIVHVEKDFFRLKKAVYYARIDETESFEIQVRAMKNYKLCDHSGLSVLHLAARLGHVELIGFILNSSEVGVDFSTEHYPFSADHHHSSIDDGRRGSKYVGPTALFEACYFFQENAVRVLDSRGAWWQNRREISDSCPLNVLIWSGGSKLAYDILSKKKGSELKNFDWNLRDKASRSALDLAVWSFSYHCERFAEASNDDRDSVGRAILQFVEFLESRGEVNVSGVSLPFFANPRLIPTNEESARVEMRFGDTIFHSLARLPEDDDKSDEEQMGVQLGKKLLDRYGLRDLTPVALNADGLTPMNVAVVHGHFGFIKWLAECRINPYDRSADGRRSVNMVNPSMRNCDAIREFLLNYMRRYSNDPLAIDASDRTKIGLKY